MYRNIKSIILAFVLFLNIYSKYLGKNKNGIKLFTINIDLPPEKRFTEPTL
jgi:hypothetical protein